MVELMETHEDDYVESRVAGNARWTIYFQIMYLITFH